MYSAKVNNQQTFEITLDGDQILVNNQPFTADFCAIDAQNTHVIHKDNNYNAEIINANPDNIQIKVNGNIYTVGIQNDLQQLLQKMGIDTTKIQKINELKSPMPGLVLKILVEAGAHVQKGDPLLVLESMKMENILKASGEGTVANVACVQGSTVEKGALLIAFA